MKASLLVVTVCVLVLAGCARPATSAVTPQRSAIGTEPPETAPPPHGTPTRSVTPGHLPTVGGSPLATPIPTSAPPPDDGSESILDTTLGQAVRLYNSSHARRITVYVVSSTSIGLDREMYEDLVARGWRMMGPEDFVGSVTKLGWPYIVIAEEDALNANPVEVWLYVLEHESVHMVAADNLAHEGVNLAQVMRGADGSFTHMARFHEVCADYYPLDSEGNHRPVAEFYGALARMPQLLSALAEYDTEDLAYNPPAHFEVLEITGVPIVDAACVWDREAMERVIFLYDTLIGRGAFEVLFPSY